MKLQSSSSLRVVTCHAGRWKHWRLKGIGSKSLGFTKYPKCWGCRGSRRRTSWGTTRCLLLTLLLPIWIGKRHCMKRLRDDIRADLSQHDCCIQHHSSSLSDCYRTGTALFGCVRKDFRSSGGARRINQNGHARACPEGNTHPCFLVRSSRGTKFTFGSSPGNVASRRTTSH